MCQSGQVPKREHRRIADEGQNKNGHSWEEDITSMYRKAKAK